MMEKEKSSGNPEKAHIGSELVIPTIALAFTLYYFSTIIDSPWTAQVSAFFIGAVLIALIAAFFIYKIVSVTRGEADLGFQHLTGPLSFMPKRVILFALTLFFMFFIEWGGFTLTTFIFLSGAMLTLSGGQNRKLILTLSATLAIGGYFLFVYAFEVRFPKGPFELMMAQVL